MREGGEAIHITNPIRRGEIVGEEEETERKERECERGDLGSVLN